MLRDEVIQALKEHRRKLSKYGVKSVAIFGSVARAEQTSTSDVDLLVEFERPVGLFVFVDLRDYLESILDKKVDLVTKQALHPKLKNQIIKQLKYAY